MLSRAVASRRRLRVLLAAVCLVGSVLTLAAADAQAKVVRPYTGKSFGPEGLGAGTFTNITSLAVDQSTGDVYVFDRRRDAIFKFTAAGEPSDFSSTGTNAIEGVTSTGEAPEQQIAVDGSSGPAKGDIYLANNQVVLIYSATGAKLGELAGGEPCGVAVDGTGAVYVGFYPSTVTKYVPSSNPVSNADATGSLSGLSSICNIAVDGEGSVYAATYLGGVRKYSALQFGALEAEGTLIDKSGAILAADPATNHLFVDEGVDVAEFNAAGEPERHIGTSELEGSLGVAVDAATDDVYIDDAPGQGLSESPPGRVEIFGPAIAEPDVTSEAPTNVMAKTATLNGTVNPEGLEVTECFFEYGEEASYGKTAPCVETVGSGTSPVAVHADIAGLDQLEAYHYRLAVKDAHGQTVNGADQTFTTSAPPGISNVRLDEVESTYVVLSASVAPNNAPATYHVDYGETSAYGSSTAESPSVGSDAEQHIVRTTIGGLKPGTIYHYRFVVTNEDGIAMGADEEAQTYPVEQRQTGCPNESLRYGYGASLPDCRAYEQATPVEKDGTNPQTAYNAIQAAVGGAGITFHSQAGVPGATGAQTLPDYLATRGTDSWTTQGLLAPATAGQRDTVDGWTPDLADTFESVSQIGSGTAFLARNNANGSIQTIVPYAQNEPKYRFVGASDDDERVFFEEPTGKQLTPEAAVGKDNLYVWDRATGAVSLVGVLPGSACGSPPCVPTGGSFAGAYNWWDETGAAALRHGGAADEFFTQAEHAISADGEKAYFTAGETGQLYLRENPTSAAATTVHISASQKTNGAGPAGTDPNGPQPAAFMAATPDGSQALFTSAEELTNDANTGASDEGRDLYRYDAASGTLTDLAPDSSDPNGAEVQGVIGVSEDGSYVYFAANGDLDGSGPATRGNCTDSGVDKKSGECSLYLWHDGEVTFVAKLDTSGDLGGAVAPDALDWTPRDSTLAGGHTPNTARVSANGSVVLFRSQRRLTAYNNNGVPEFYRYDAETQQLDCVSCNPAGASPTTGPQLQAQTAFLGAGAHAAIETRNLSASGDQFFFETDESLLPADTNGTTDVYEWEADGAGSCAGSAEDGGCLYLLSTGKDPDPSGFGDASASGEDVFIFTEQPLVGGDQDQLVDAYDVRVDGGLASQHAEPTVPCSGEACKGAVAPATTTAPPDSATFAGAGNLTAPPTSTPRAVGAVKVLGHSVHGTMITLKVAAPSKGWLIVYGAGLQTARHRVGAATIYTLKVKLAASEIKRLRRHKSKPESRLRLRVRFVPRSGAASLTSVSVTVKA